MDWNELAEKIEGSQQERWTAQMMFRSRRLKSPPMRFWLSYVGRRIVDDIFTYPDYRHRGLATALSTPTSRTPALAVLAPSP